MKKLILIVLLFGFSTSLFSADAIKKTYGINKSIYVKPDYLYKPSTCQYTCEEVKDGYFARVSNVNIEKGLTTCRIYSVKEPLKILEERKLFNKHCKKDYTFIPNRNVEEPDTLRLEDKLKALETKYFKNFINTGDVQYLTAPEYLVAVLTADADVINIKDTLEENRIVLNQEYTIYPNEQKNYERTWRNAIYSSSMSIWNEVVNGFNSFVGKDERSNIVIPPDNMSVEFTSSSSQLISTIGVFWLDFLTESNFLYQETNFLIVMILAPFSLIVMTGESYTQKLSKMGGGNNWVGGGIVSVLVCLTMFTTYNVAKTGKEDIFGQQKNLDQSFYQDNTSFLFASGVKIANSFNATFNKVYINQMARNASVNPTLTQGEREQKLEHFKKLSVVYSNYLNTCSRVYDTETLSNISTSLYNNPFLYPPDEVYGSISFYNYLKNPKDLITHNIYSVDSCYEIDRQKKILLLRMNALSKEIQYGKLAIENGMERRVLNIAEVAYKNTVEMGFFSALTTASMNSTLSNIEEYQHYSDDIDDKRAYIEKETQKMLYNQNASITDMLDNDFISWLPRNLPYYSMPFFASIYEGVNDMVSFGAKRTKRNTVRKHRAKKEKLEKEGIDASEGVSIGMVGDFILGLARGHKGFAIIESMIKMGGNAIALAVSIWIYEYFLALLVPFAILSAGLMVVLFWIAEVVIYYLVVPFMLAYAMLKSQGQAVMKFLGRGLIIASRPTLIVFSIIVAILLNELYEAISIFIITKNFSALFGLNELGMIDTFMGVMQQSFYEVALRLFIPFIMFFIILAGSTIFLKQFGWSDEADFGQQVTSSLEARGGRYNLPV